MSSYSDKYFEFKVELKDLISPSEDEIKLDFIGKTNEDKVSCVGKMIFNKVNENFEKNNDSWIVDTSINISSEFYTEGCYIKNTSHVNTQKGVLVQPKDLFLAVLNETSKNANLVSDIRENNKLVVSNSALKGYTNLINELMLAVYIYPIEDIKEKPIITFRAPSFSNPEVQSYPEDNVNTIRDTQTRAISNIEGLNESGKLVAEKLNALKETPKLIVDIVTGKGSDVYIGHYSWYFSDTEQFSNIESFDANFGASTYKYNMLCTDNRNIFGEGITGAEVVWTFPGAGEPGLDTFKVTFIDGVAN